MTSPLSPSPAIVETGSPVLSEAAAWSESLLNHIAGAGEDGALAVDFIKSHRVKIGFRKQKVTGAMWSPDGNIYLNANYYSLATAPIDPFMSGLVVHEALHLKQRVFTALSVYGELEAWQLGFRIFQILGGKIFSSALDQLLNLPLSYKREILSTARFLMQDYAGKGYRVDLLPRYPLPKEITYLFTRKIPD
jgi:hypothetical protein